MRRTATTTLDGQRSWREAAWRAVTPDTRIERHGAYDMLVPTHGRYAARYVRVLVTPSSVTVEREYDPAVAFSNGPTALYSGQI